MVVMGLGMLDGRCCDSLFSAAPDSGFFFGLSLHSLFSFLFIASTLSSSAGIIFGWGIRGSACCGSDTDRAEVTGNSLTGVVSEVLSVD